MDLVLKIIENIGFKTELGKKLVRGSLLYCLCLVIYLALFVLGRICFPSLQLCKTRIAWMPLGLWVKRQMIC
jgi:hypothetical protein